MTILSVFQNTVTYAVRVYLKALGELKIGTRNKAVLMKFFWGACP